MMRNFPTLPALYFFFFMGLLLWVACTCFMRKQTGQTGIKMAQVEQIRNATQSRDL